MQYLGLTAGMILALGTLPGARAGELFPPAVDETVDTSHWSCVLCSYRTGWYGSLEWGPGYVSDSSLAYADYRGLDEQGAFPALDGEVHYRNGSDRYLDIYAKSPGLQNRSLEMRTGLRGRYQIRLAYREIPKFRGYGASTVYSGVGSSRLSLPQDWQKSFTTAGMTGLEGALIPISLKTTRRTLHGGLSLKFAQKWTWDVELQHETKDGSRPFGAGLYTINTSQFPAPVDFTTNRLESGLQYSGIKGHWRLGFSASRFENGTNSITWENPFSSAPENQLFRAALAPDNTFYQLNLQGVYSLRPGFRFSGRAAIGRLRQGEPLLPYSINPAFSELELPRREVNQRIDTGTVNIAGKVTARLGSRLDFSASGKFDRRDNKTPVDAYTIVITDFLPGGERVNRPYSFDRKKYDLELRYLAIAGVNLRAGAARESYQRTLQSVLRTKEWLHWGELNFSRWSVAELRVKLEKSSRDASPYRQVDTTGLIENPLMRKFNYADRDRRRVVTELDFAPGQTWWLNLSWSRSEDEYPQSAAGLRRSREDNLSLDFGLYLGRYFSLSAFISRDDITSALSGFDAFAESTWDAFTDDQVTTLGSGVMAKPNKRVTLELNWTQSQSRGRIAVAESPQFPVLHNRIASFRGSVSVDLNDNWAWKLTAEREHLTTEDWQTDGFGPGSIANVLTLSDVSPRYRVTALFLQTICRY